MDIYVSHIWRNHLTDCHATERATDKITFFSRRHDIGKVNYTWPIKKKTPFTVK